MVSVRASCSDELLSVQGVNTPHLMLHAREAHWQTPITEAPHLGWTVLYKDPRVVRARRPLIMMMRSLTTARWNRAGWAFRQRPA